MAILDHWHPVLLAQALRERPVGVTFAGRRFALFRDGRGGIGALEDCCPHRRMRLSLGSVRDGRLVCCYHGWRFTCDGAGESPGTPKLHAQAAGLRAVERDGAIWLRSPRLLDQSPARPEDAPPRLDAAGYHPLGNLYHVVHVPLELVVDNFTEVEHTPTTHALLGYELDRMHEVETRVEAAETSVRVYNAGPQKRIGKALELLFGIRAGDIFVDDWTTYFAPVHAVYDQYWMDPRTKEEHGLRWRIHVFFTPIDDATTALVTFAQLKVQPTLQSRLARWRALRPLLLAIVGREIDLDVRMMENLADKSPAIEGMKLSRFDKTLGLHRERIARIYRGNGVATAREPRGAETAAGS